MILFFLAFACTPDTETDVYNDIDTAPTPLVGCDEQEFEDGLTLVGLPVDANVAVSHIAEDGEVYTQTITVDACGAATPFTEMSLDDFGGLGELSSVYAQVVEDPSADVFHGVFLTAEPNAPPETSISTQWELVGDDEWVAIRDSELGVLIGILMIP